MNRGLLGHIAIQLLVAGIAAIIALVAAIFLSGAVGGMAVGVAPEFSFGLVSNIVCPDGMLVYSSIERSFHQPGESEPFVECVGPDGVSDDRFLPAISAVFGLAFGAVFLLTCLPTWAILAVIGWIIIRLINRSADTQPKVLPED